MVEQDLVDKGHLRDSPVGKEEAAFQWVEVEVDTLVHQVEMDHPEAADFQERLEAEASREHQEVADSREHQEAVGFREHPEAEHFQWEAAYRSEEQEEPADYHRHHHHSPDYKLRCHTMIHHMGLTRYSPR